MKSKAEWENVLRNLKLSRSKNIDKSDPKTENEICEFLIKWEADGIKIDVKKSVIFAEWGSNPELMHRIYRISKDSWAHQFELRWSD